MVKPEKIFIQTLAAKLAQIHGWPMAGWKIEDGSLVVDTGTEKMKVECDRVCKLFRYKSAKIDGEYMVCEPFSAEETDAYFADLDARARKYAAEKRAREEAEAAKAS